MELNTYQKQVLLSKAKSLIVIAGPGTGKTHTLTSKIAYLIKNKTSPKSILALTFTNKAADEMKKRIKQMVAGNAIPNITTFHGYAYQRICKEKNTSVTLINEQDKMRILQTIIYKNNIFKTLKKYNIRDISLFVSLYRQTNNCDYQEIKILSDYYTNLLLQKERLDFDDLLIEYNNNFNSLHKNTKNNFQYIFVDEFQDTNYLQFSILQKMRAFSKQTIVIGDPNQSIYSFRGGSSDLFNKFAQSDHKTQTIVLKINYRNTYEVIKTAQAMFPNTHKQKSCKKETGFVRLIYTWDEFSEAHFILDTIIKNTGGTDLISAHNSMGFNNQYESDFSDYAVLYRTKKQLSVLSNAFASSGIPYQIAGEDSPYNSDEIIALLAILNFLLQPSINTAVHMIERCFVKIRSNEIIQICTSLQASDKNTDLRKLMLKIKNKRAKKLINEILKIEKQNAENKYNLTRILTNIIDNTCVACLFTNKKRANEKFSNLLQRAREWDKEKNSIQEFLKYIQELAQNDFYDKKRDAITLMTMHAAKGLEFPFIFITGFEQGIIPYKGNNDINEEKRLFYVALTRASKNAFIICTKYRFRKKQNPSDFLKDIKDYIQICNDPNLERSEKKAIKKNQMQMF